MRKAFLFATSERYFGTAIGLVTVPIISRLLTPGEVGIWIVALAIMTFVTAIRELAGYQFLIQKPDLTREDIRSSVTITALVTIVIAGSLAVSAPWIAAAYQNDGITLCLRVVAIALLLELISTPLLTLLRRDMSFGKLAVINVSAAAANAAATILLAVLGFSYMSYAWGALLAAAISVSMVLYMRPDLWIFRPSLEMWRGPLTFGGYFGTNVVLFRAYESFFFVLIGRMLSLDAAGLFQRAVAIVTIPDRLFFGGVAALALPGFSAHQRAGGSPKVAYLRAIEYVTGVQWPAFILLAILAYPVVVILLGQQWLESVPLVRILAVAGLFTFTAHFDYALLIAVGAMRDNTKRALVVVPISVIVLLIASTFGLVGIAVSQVILKPFETFVSFYFVRRNVPIQWSDLVPALWRSAAVSLCTAVGTAIVVAIELRLELSIPGAFLAAFLGAAGWFVGLWLVQHPLLDEISQAARALRRSPSAGKVLDAILSVRK
jgi:O-antigen/teichoic acid export membrane protein